MIKKMLVAGLLLGAAAPALAQSNVAPPAYAPLQDYPTCTRAELKAATDAYVKAQSRGDISGLPLAANAHYLENMSTNDAKAGLWNTALPIAHAMSFHDDKRCKTFTEIIVTGGGHPYVIGTRLYLHGGKIIRVDSLVTDKDDWLFNAGATLKFTKREGNWLDLNKYQKTAPAEMIRGANAYLDRFSDKLTDVPWGTPCTRLEGGHYTDPNGDPQATCERGIPAGVLYIVNRDYLIDEEKGVINVFCRFVDSNGMPDSHSFRFIDGKIRNVHTISVNLTATPSPQADDDGGVLTN
ncbi:MAG TPA: hypothetical protein VGC27_09820 [Rhizomicrobium sp.]